MILLVENLSVNYGKIEASPEVSLRIEGGKIVALIGANGAETLLGPQRQRQSAAGYLHPQRP